jgi:hypothetical protein
VTPELSGQTARAVVALFSCLSGDTHERFFATCSDFEVLEVFLSRLCVPQSIEFDEAIAMRWTRSAVEGFRLLMASASDELLKRLLNAMADLRVDSRIYSTGGSCGDAFTLVAELADAALRADHPVRIALPRVLLLAPSSPI